jgi:hypothetical protein
MNVGSAIGLAPRRRQRLRLAIGRARAWLLRYVRGAAGSVHLAPVEPPPVVLASPSHFYQRRQVLVAEDLRMLRGPVTGTITLPELLHWSGDENAARFDLDDPRQRPALYVTVLREAQAPSELGDWLNSDWLIELWPRLVLPKPVRAAWEQQHPVLREARMSRELRAAS